MLTMAVERATFALARRLGIPNNSRAFGCRQRESRGGEEAVQEVSATFFCWDGRCACQFSGAVTRQSREMASKRTIYFGSYVQRSQFRVLSL